MADMNIAVAASSDDGFHYETGGLNTQTTMYFGDDGNESTAFVRFTIPSPGLTGATISTATLDCYFHETAGITIRLRAIDSDDPTAPTSWSDLSGRAMTTANVSWTTTPTGGGGARTSPNIATVIQELVDTYDMAAGDHFVIYLDARLDTQTTTNEVAAWDHATEPPVEIDINYTTGVSTSATINGGGSVSASVTKNTPWTATLVQHSSYRQTGLSVTISGTQGQPAVWGTPTSGNTLIAMVITRENLTAFTSGWTQAALHEVGSYFAYIYTKTSVGTETSLTATMDTSEAQMMAVWEFADDFVFEEAAFTEAESVLTVGATTGTLNRANSLALAFAHHWYSGDTSFDNSFTRNSHYAGGTYSNLYYQGAAYKSLSSTSAVTCNATWGGSSGGSIVLAIFNAVVTTSATINAGGSISAEMTKYLNQVARPASTITAGTWDTGPTAGQSLHGYTSDDSDTTYIHDTTV